MKKKTSDITGVERSKKSIKNRPAQSAGLLVEHSGIEPLTSTLPVVILNKS